MTCVEHAVASGGPAGDSLERERRGADPRLRGRRFCEPGVSQLFCACFWKFCAENCGDLWRYTAKQGSAPHEPRTILTARRNGKPSTSATRWSPSPKGGSEKGDM